MANGVTNRGRRLILGAYFNDETRPTNLYAALCDDSVTPTVDTNTLSQLGEIPAGNGYTSGGQSLTRNTTDFPNITENDTTDLASVDLKNLTFTASGGNLPASGNGARWLVITTDEATVGNRQIICWFDLTANRIVSDGQSLNLNSGKIQITLPA